MTSKEIREQVSPMVIWVADTTIRQARRAITGKTDWNDVKRNAYNLPEVEMAGEVLFNVFETFSAAIKDALLQMPVEMDGIGSVTGKNYFDEFVAALNDRLQRYGDTRGVKLREADWVLDLC